MMESFTALVAFHLAHLHVTRDPQVAQINHKQSRQAYHYAN